MFECWMLLPVTTRYCSNCKICYLETLQQLSNILRTVQTWFQVAASAKKTLLREAAKKVRFSCPATKALLGAPHLWA